jgi:hypothetical protein
MSAFAAGLDRCEAQENIVGFNALFSEAHFYVATLMTKLLNQTFRWTR